MEIIYNYGAEAMNRGDLALAEATFSNLITSDREHSRAYVCRFAVRLKMGFKANTAARFRHCLLDNLRDIPMDSNPVRASS